MNSHEVIALYETVAVITDQMLSAARSGDWDRVAVLEERCAGHVATLKSDEPPAPLTGEIRVRKVQIIKQILAHDREIRDIAEPWMARLAQMIGSTGAERKLVQAYGAGHSG
jgi:flagellar protein FliT